jgi:hypothetical protein
MHGGMKIYAGSPAAARNYVEADRSRPDDYYLAEGTGLAERYVASPDAVVRRMSSGAPAATPPASSSTNKHACAPTTPPPTVPTTRRSMFPGTSDRIATPARASADEPTIPDQHQPTPQDHESITVTEDVASMTQEISPIPSEGHRHPTSHGAIMNNTTNTRTRTTTISSIDEAAGILRTPKPPCATGGTSAPDLAASASAAASSPRRRPPQSRITAQHDKRTQPRVGRQKRTGITPLRIGPNVLPPHRDVDQEVRRCQASRRVRDGELRWYAPSATPPARRGQVFTRRVDAERFSPPLKGP